MTRSECEGVLRCICHTHDVELQRLDYDSSTGTVRLKCSTFDGEPIGAGKACCVQQDAIDALPMGLDVDVS